MNAQDATRAPDSAPLRVAAKQWSRRYDVLEISLPGIDAICYSAPDLEVVSMNPRQGWYRRWGKRLFDVAAALSLLACLWPILVVVSLLVRRRHGSPVVFRQKRPGLNGQVFEIFKFRTMTNARDAAGQLLPDEQRLTPFGQWLRSTSLDELPELWNILRGEMSFVGPRPLLVQYLPLYSREQARRHEVRPGLTGWAQIHGRNATTWDERLSQDVWYVDHLSLWLDLKILLATVGKVLRRDGIAADNAATMPEFFGSNSDAGQRRAA